MTPSELANWARTTPTVTDDFGNSTARSNPARPVDSFGNQYTGKGANARPVMGNPNNMPAPPSPNGPASPGIKATPPASTAGSLGATLVGAATSPAALATAGIAGALYPTPMGDGTLDSPEAKRAMAQNDALRANQAIQDKANAINSTPPLVTAPVAPPSATTTAPPTAATPTAPPTFTPRPPGATSPVFAGGSLQDSLSKLPEPAAQMVSGKPLTEVFPDAAPLAGTTAAQAAQSPGTWADTKAKMTAPVDPKDQMFSKVFDNSSVPDFRTAKGGYVGATTDAEAKRNMQSRMEQDQAADYMVGRYNKAIESMRDTRAMSRGISRGALDSQEKFNSPYAQEYDARQAAGAPFEAMKGALGDYQKEMAAIAEARAGAPRGRFGDRTKREALYKEMDARAAGAQNALNAALGIGGKQLDAESGRQNALAEADAKRYSAQASLYGSQLTAQQQAEKNRIDAQKNRLDAEQKNAELGVQGVDAMTKRLALTQKPQTGTDQLAQERIALIRALGDPKTTNDQRKAIREQLMFFGGQPDPATMAMSMAEQQEKP